MRTLIARAQPWADALPGLREHIATAPEIGSGYIDWATLRALALRVVGVDGDVYGLASHVFARYCRHIGLDFEPDPHTLPLKKERLIEALTEQ